MSLKKRWQDLDRETVRSAPDRPAFYELGDDDGNVLTRDAGILRDELKEALTYHEATAVRWEVAQSLDHAQRLLAEHVDGTEDADGVEETDADGVEETDADGADDA